MGTSENNNGELISITVGFNLCYGMEMQTTVLPNDVRKATNDEIHCFCGYNSQTLDQGEGEYENL